MLKKISNPVTSIKTADHYTWGDACDGWWLKKTGQFTVIYERMPNGTAEVKHYHKKTEQFFYVLEGTLTIELNEVAYELHPHEGITILPTEKHRVFNRSDQYVSFLVISSPNSHDDRINV